MNPAGHVRASLRALLATWRGRFILAFVVLQLLIPIRYYIGARDPHDERFAWRMFSPMRMTRCTPDFEVNGKRVALDADFHEAWLELAQRGRFVVLEAMAAHLCDKYPGAAVKLELSCSYLDQDRHTYGHADMCKEPRL